VIVRQNAGDVIIEGEGIIYVHKEKIEAGLVLEMLDPQAIDAEALSRMGFEGESEKSLTEVIIDIIKEAIDAAGS
jgi:predicted glycosyltransferase